MNTKTDIPTRLLWVDLEMTGLDASKDVILEIAAEITDFDFKTLASYEARIQQKPEVTAARMQANKVFWDANPENRDDFLKKIEHGKPLKIVESEMLALIDQHFGSEPAILAGNSIHNDRMFITSWWPLLDLRLHYRMLDVSSFKILMQGKYAEVFEKNSSHRAFDDIQASIAELQHYLSFLKP